MNIRFPQRVIDLYLYRKVTYVVTQYIRVYRDEMVNKGFAIYNTVFSSMSLNTTLNGKINGVSWLSPDHSTVVDHWSMISIITVSSAVLRTWSEVYLDSIAGVYQYLHWCPRPVHCLCLDMAYYRSTLNHIPIYNHTSTLLS